MSHLPLDARAILHYLNELGYRNISAEQLKEFLKGMQPQSNNNASKKQYNQQQPHHHLLPATTATSTTGSQPQQRTPIKIIKSKKPLCQYKFYLDICDHQLTKRIEEHIRKLGGVLEFFLTASVTHFITDKPTHTQHHHNNNNSQPGTPQTPATPGTPQTPYSLETNDATPIAANKRTRTSRADAILNRARRQSTTASVLTRTPTTTATPSARSTTKELPALATGNDVTPPYIVWPTEYALRFFKKVQTELRPYLEAPKDKQKASNSNSGPKTKLVEPITLKGNFIKIESFKRNYRPYYQLFKKPIEWPKIELKRDDGAFRLSPRKHVDDFRTTHTAAAIATNLQTKTKMTRKSRSRSSQHRPLPATVQALKKQSIDGSPKASTGMQRQSKLTACNKDVKESSDKQCGVCEICKIEYDTLSIHLKSKDHEFFAKNAQNFIALDTLINASADVSKFLEDNKKMELEEMEVDEETNTEASALDPLNNPTPTIGLVEEKRRSSGAYKTPSPTLREKSKRITKGKHSSEKFQKTEVTVATNTAQTTTTITSKSSRSSPTKSHQTHAPCRSPEKRQSSCVMELPTNDTRKVGNSMFNGATRKKTSSVLPLSPPIRPMLPQSPLYKVVETPEMRTPKRRIRLGAGEDAHMVDSPSLIVKFQKVRSTELERLNGEAESFMYRRHAISSDLPTDQDRQTTSDAARVSSFSSGSLDSTSESHDMLDIENLQQPVTQKAIAKAKRRKGAAAMCKQSFPDAPIQPDVQVNAKTSCTNKRPATTATVSSTACFALPEATRKSSRTATAIVTAATTSSLLQAAVDAARQNSRKRVTLPKSSHEQAMTPVDQANTVIETQSQGRTRRAIVKLEDRMGDASSTTTTIQPQINTKLKIKLERHTPIPKAAKVETPKTITAPPIPAHSLDLLDFEVFDDDEDIDNDDVKDEDFKLRKRKRKPTLKAAAAASTTNISTSRRAASFGTRRRCRGAWYAAADIKQEVLTETEIEAEQNSAEDAGNTEDDGSQAEFALNEESSGSEQDDAQVTMPQSKTIATKRRRRRIRLGTRRKKKRAIRQVGGRRLAAKQAVAVESAEEATINDSMSLIGQQASPVKTPQKRTKLAKEQNSPTTSEASSPDKAKSTNTRVHPSKIFDYTQSEHINKMQYAFERLPIADHWYRVFARQDACQEKYFEYFGPTKYRKLPYELGPIPFDTTLKGVHCKFCSEEETSAKADTAASHTSKMDEESGTPIASNKAPHDGNVTSSAYLHRHKKLHLLQRYRKEQQELLQQQQQLEQSDKSTPLEDNKLEFNPAAEGTTAITTGVSANCHSSKASTPDLEQAPEPGPRKRAGSTHSTASSCASSSATLNKKPFRNKHLNKAVFLSLELPPRKSPREHASTLALVSCIIKQRQDSLSKNNSETDEPPTTPTTPTMLLKPIKQELGTEPPLDANQMNGTLESDADAEAVEDVAVEVAKERRIKEELETRQQAAMVAQREKTPAPAEQQQQQPTACSPRTTRSTAATPIEEMRFATEISETVKRMRRGQNKYDHSPPFVAPHATTVTPKSAAATSPSAQISPRKRGRPPKDKSAVVANLSMSILPYKRRGADGLPIHLHERSSSNRSNTPNSNRSSGKLHRGSNAYKRRGRPSMLNKLAAYNHVHSNYSLSPAIRKTGTKKGVIEFEVDTCALKALELATQHTNVAHLEWEIDKYLQFACKDYDVNLDTPQTEAVDMPVSVTEDDQAMSTGAPVEETSSQETPTHAQTPPPTDYFSSDFDLCDLLESSAQFAGACAAYGAQPEGKRRAYSVYSAVAFENYFRKRRCIKKNRTGWPSTQRRRVGTRDQRKTRRNIASNDELKNQPDDHKVHVDNEDENPAAGADADAGDNKKSNDEATRRESGVITPPDSEAEEERASAKTTASLENAEDYEGAESTEIDPAESVQDDDEDDDEEEEGADGAEADEEEEEEVFADAEGGVDDEDIDADAETMADSVDDETCTQDMDEEADEEDDDEDDEMDHADMLTLNNDDDHANGNDDEEEEGDDEAHEHEIHDEHENEEAHDDEFERRTENSDDFKNEEKADGVDDEEDEEEFELAADNAKQEDDAHDLMGHDDDVEEEVAQASSNHHSFLAAFGAKTTKSTASSKTSRTRQPRSNHSAVANNGISLEQKLNHSNFLTVPTLSHNVTSTPTNHLLRALRRTPQLNGSLGSCISPSEKAGDNSDIFTVSSDGLDTDLDLSNQQAQLRGTSGITVGMDDEAANECPHHGNSSSATTPKRKLDITKYAPKNAGSTCAAEAATAAVKSLAISQFLKKEVRVTCRRIRAPFRRFRFRR